VKRLFLISLISNISLLANQEIQPLQPKMQGLTAWLIVSLIIISVLFWSFYKAIKTKNPKYGYVILVCVVLMVGLLFV